MLLGWIFLSLIAGFVAGGMFVASFNPEDMAQHLVKGRELLADLDEQRMKMKDQKIGVELAERDLKDLRKRLLIDLEGARKLMREGKEFFCVNCKKNVQP